MISLEQHIQESRAALLERCLRLEQEKHALALALEAERALVRTLAAARRAARPKEQVSNF